MADKLRMAGMHHIALRVSNLEVCERFYVDLLGYTVEWRPDSDNVYLSSGFDNIALHREPTDSKKDRLDHMGIILFSPDDVDRWFEFLKQRSVVIEKPPRTHRDGARSFYCRDPEGTVIQMMYHPPLVPSSEDV